MSPFIEDLPKYDPPKPESQFLTFEEGDNVVRLVSHSFTSFSHYDPQTKRSTICTGDPSTCPLCQKGKKPRQRWAWIVLSRKDNKPYIIEVGWQAFKQILAFAKNKEFGDPRQYDLTITKTRTGPRIMDVEYSVVAARKNVPLTKEEEKIVKEVDIDLARIYKAKEEPPVFIPEEAKEAINEATGKKGKTVAKGQKKPN